MQLNVLYVFIVVGMWIAGTRVASKSGLYNNYQPSCCRVGLFIGNSQYKIPHIKKKKKKCVHVFVKYA